MQGVLTAKISCSSCNAIALLSGDRFACSCSFWVMFCRIGDEGIDGGGGVSGCISQARIISFTSPYSVVSNGAMEKCLDTEEASGEEVGVPSPRCARSCALRFSTSGSAVSL
eukprot:80161-Rhodomonas_salina.1